MTTKHTPGPWSKFRTMEGYLITTPKSDVHHAACFTLGDATLIASAPELLDALKQARDEIHFLQDKTGFKDKQKLKRFDKTIAKAEGRE